MTTSNQVKQRFIILTIVTGIFFFVGFIYMVQKVSILHPSMPVVSVGSTDLLNTSNETSVIYFNTEVADRLKQKVRVLCWVMTAPTPENRNRSMAIKDTWDAELGTAALKFVKEGRDYIWAKTRGAFRYIYKHHFNKADWFLKVDDDTFVIMENLRYLLKGYDPKLPIYFGCRLKMLRNSSFMSGGAGYVLSKEALRRFVKKALRNKAKCSQDHGGPEDVEIAKCLENVGVRAGDSRDTLGRHRFNPFPPEVHVMKPPLVNWYIEGSYYPPNTGKNCCADTAISFHYIEPRQMYAMYYQIYHLRPYGIAYGYRDQSTSNASRSPVHITKSFTSNNPGFVP